MWTDKGIQQLIQKYKPGVSKEQYKYDFETQEKVQDDLEKSYEQTISKYPVVKNKEVGKALFHFLGQGDGELYLKTLIQTGSYDKAQQAVDQSILNRTKKPNPNKITVEQYLDNIKSLIS